MYIYDINLVTHLGQIKFIAWVPNECLHHVGELGTLFNELETKAEIYLTVARSNKDLCTDKLRGAQTSMSIEIS